MRTAALIAALLAIPAFALSVSAEPVVNANPVILAGTLVEGETTWTRIGDTLLSPAFCGYDVDSLQTVRLDVIGLTPGDLVSVRGASVETFVEAQTPTVLVDAYAPDDCMPALRITGIAIAARAFWVQTQPCPVEPLGVDCP